MYEGTVVGRALDIVLCIGESAGAGQTLTSVADLTGLPRATARRIAQDLVARGVLARSGSVYTLGPVLERLGRQAELQRVFAGVHDELVGIAAKFGGFAWLSVGYEFTTLEPLDLVCGDKLKHFRDRWPRLSLETLVNTAAGRLLLIERPDLLRMATANGIPRCTPHSPATRNELDRHLRQVKDSGVAVEAEQYMLGWRCVAQRVHGPNGQVAAIGATVPIQHGSFRRVIQEVSRATSAVGHGDGS